MHKYVMNTQGFPRYRSTVTENLCLRNIFIDGRYVMVVKGAVDVLLERMSHIQDGDTLRKITEEDRVRIEVQNKTFFQKTDCEFLHLHLRRWNRSRGLH